MQSDWQIFLNQQGAAFGDAAAELKAAVHGAVLCNLDQFATLRVSGMDAQSFLQNLLSNDILEVSASKAQFSSFNSAKGRILATFLIWREGDDYLLQLPGTLADALRKKLSMYVLRAKVSITDASDEIVSLGLSGERAPLPGNCLELPSLGTAHIPDACVIKLDDSRFMLSTTPKLAPALWKTLSMHAQPVGSSYWDWLNIRAGIPVILPQTQEQFVPQMANLDLINAVNFKKGCYPGQEIVARMHYLGRLKRRMYLAHVEELALAGDELFSADMADQACGMVANAAPAPAGGYDVLAVVQISSHESQTVHLHSQQGAPLKFEALPYPLP